MNGKITLIFPLLLIFIIITAVNGYDPETVKIMPFVTSESYCKKCHDTKDNIKIDLSLACDTYCITCHKKTNSKTHHKIDIRLKLSSKHNFKLTNLNKITCYTCHNLHNNRFDKIPWKSASLFEKLFKKKGQYKTYYLVTNNRNGELCKKCH